jgi:Fur family ferric uptake transcriptional regulator
VRFLSRAWRPRQAGGQPFAVAYQHVTKENLTRQSEEVRDISELTESNKPHKILMKIFSIRVMDEKNLKSVFRNKKLRMSQPRQVIYQQLSATSKPLSPQEIYRGVLKEDRKIGLTSIYRCLDLFETLGIAFRVVLGPHVKYKLCELEHHHHHIVCKACGHVVELEFCDMPKWSKKVMKSTGYQVTDHQLSFYGVCRACREKA